MTYSKSTTHETNLPKDLIAETWSRIDDIVSDIKEKAEEWVGRSFFWEEEYVQELCYESGFDTEDEHDKSIIEDVVDYDQFRDFVHDNSDIPLNISTGEDDADKTIDYLSELFYEIDSKILVNDIYGLEVCIKMLFKENYDSKFDCSENWDELEELIEILKINDLKTIYIPKKPELYIPELIVSANRQLFYELSREKTLLHKLPPRIFEEIIAEIFKSKGFEVELTKQTRDGGKDIIALNNILGIETKIIIECKRYSLDNKVGLSYVQRLLGVKYAERANKAILATTSYFTQEAIVFQRSNFWELDLKDYNDVMRWIDNYNTYNSI